MIYVSSGPFGYPEFSEQPTENALAFPVPVGVGEELDFLLMRHSAEELCKDLEMGEEDNTVFFPELAKAAGAFYRHEYVKQFIKTGTLKSLTWIEISTAWLAVLREPIEGVSETLRDFLRLCFSGDCMPRTGRLMR